MASFSPILIAKLFRKNKSLRFVIAINPNKVLSSVFSYFFWLMADMLYVLWSLEEVTQKHTVFWGLLLLKKKTMNSLLTVNMNTNRLKGKIIFLSPVWGYFQGYVLPNSNSIVGKFHPWKKRRGIGSFTTDFPTSGNFPFDIDPTTISKTMYSRQVGGGIVGISDEDLVRRLSLLPLEN